MTNLTSPMVRKVAINLDGKSANELAENDAELMRLWGEINNAWDDIERLLYIAFDAMLSEETSYATQAIFYSQTSHAARRTMVQSLAKYALLNRPQTARNLKNAIKRVQARSDERHKLAHGIWTVGVDLATQEYGPERIALSADLIPSPNDRFTRKRLVQVRDNMRATVIALREAIAPIEEAKRANAETLMKRHIAKAKPLEPQPQSLP